MTPEQSPALSEPDVRVSVTVGTGLGDVELRYRACLTAATVFVRETTGRADLRAVLSGDPSADLRRLPNEKLYLL
ncbi:hypothetical protein [Nocardia harenae]|uniref:hypothetical protein n=1 Tax=Nocardia harenae TaxID=358707 RepID=UPI00083422D2|nr:hypothetical protein [Nocardia harenae]